MDFSPFVQAAILGYRTVLVKNWFAYQEFTLQSHISYCFYVIFFAIFSIVPRSK